MATTTVGISGPQNQGDTTSVHIRNITTGAIVVTRVCTETDLGWYTFTLVDLPTNNYRVQHIKTASGQGLGQWGLKHNIAATEEIAGEFIFPDDLAEEGDIPPSILGPGADICTLHIESSGDDVADADVWVTSDAAGEDVIAGTSQTDSDGNVQFLLDDGNSYYLWMQKDGQNPILGKLFTAVAD